MEPVTPRSGDGDGVVAQTAGGAGAVHVLRPEELVVGARVVLRHRLPDGSAADALGDLVHADADLLVVSTRRGQVHVGRADLLAGKAVPPPPVRRGPPHEAVGTDDLERVAAEHWRPDEREDVGGWRLRATGGVTARANSALAVGSPGLDVGAALTRVEQFYARRGLPAVVAVPHPAGGGRGAGTEPADELARRGWAVAKPTLVLTAATDDVPGAADVALPAGLAVVRSAVPDAGWLDLHHPGGAGAVPPAARRLLVSADEQVFVRVLDGATTVAVARGSLSPGWAGVSALETVPSHRRRGLARRALAEVADWARSRGARSTFLQVEDGNEGALALYGGAGFSVHHGYHYRVAP